MGGSAVCFGVSSPVSRNVVGQGLGRGGRLCCTTRTTRGNARVLNGATATRCKLLNAAVPVVVEAPRELVFRLFSTVELMAYWSRTLESVSRLESDPSLSDWCFSFLGVRLSWRAQDTERVEGERIAWKAIDGVPHTGCVDFLDEPCTSGPSATKVTMTVEFEASGLLATFMETRLMSDFVEQALESDLQRFRQFALRTARKERMNQRK